ncbi:MAG: hypothetical protein JRJ77_16070 [Deltaproteobacteria bacterium]|nr:hypothetical protein [Deltaproteobacteria bacterium]
MLLDVLSRYLGSIEAEVRKLEGSYVERYEEEIIAANRVNLRIRVRFPSGHMLELNEAIVGEGDHTRHLGYRYHFQDGENNVVFRYDNTPHFPSLDNFPHHKHLPDRVASVEQPSIVNAIKEARQLSEQAKPNSNSNM